MGIRPGILRTGRYGFHSVVPSECRQCSEDATDREGSGAGRRHGPPGSLVLAAPSFAEYIADPGDLQCQTPGRKYEGGKHCSYGRTACSIGGLEKRLPALEE